ncbi:hypothetical protein C8R44DRAFT_896286 [Mycena epipterygia]|nr:hypothetical protein C8R44DRAFT_896286 [Mycena epipterygia]
MSTSTPPISRSRRHDVPSVLPASQMDARRRALSPCRAPYAGDALLGPRFVVQGAYPLDIWECPCAALERVCCTQFELILRPRSDRASNDVSICSRRSPTPIRRGPPRTPSSGIAVSSPCRLMLLQTDANTEYMLLRDAGSPTDLPSYPVSKAPLVRRMPAHPVRGTTRHLGETTPITRARPFYVNTPAQLACMSIS